MVRLTLSHSLEKNGCYIRINLEHCGEERLQFSGLIKMQYFFFEELLMPFYFSLFWKPPGNHCLFSVSERVKIVPVKWDIRSKFCHAWNDINCDKCWKSLIPFPLFFILMHFLFEVAQRRKSWSYHSSRCFQQVWNGNPVAKAVPEVWPTRKILAEQWDYFIVLIQIESENF